MEIGLGSRQDWVRGRTGFEAGLGSRQGWERGVAHRTPMDERKDCALVLLWLRRWYDDLIIYFLDSLPVFGAGLLR